MIKAGYVGNIKMRNINKQQGFTLIELIVVIVILGILAVTAAPKFIDISTDAKKANYAALTAAVKSAAKMARMKCMVDSNCIMTGSSTIDVGGETIRMLNGWPLAWPKAGMGKLLVDSGDWEIYSDSNLVTFNYPGSGNYHQSDCVITYVYAGKGDPVYNTHWGADDTCT